ncbi:MAG: tRNA (adenine(22)-N(1))-methyltransferase [Oscillospiraceae bacterium]
METFSLSPRLSAIASLVPKGAKVADVGTDHGYVPVWLVQRQVAASVIATDIKPDPLEKAVLSARRAGVEDRIKFLLCDGLRDCPPEETDTVIIAGMGGETIRNILKEAPWTRGEGRRMILQPMTKPELLRLWLNDNGYAIYGEKLVKDAGVIYPIILASGGQQPPLTEAELYTGRWELICGDPLFEDYLELLASKTARAIGGLQRSRRAEDMSRLEKLKAASAGFDIMKKRLIAKREGKDD